MKRRSFTRRRTLLAMLLLVIDVAALGAGSTAGAPPRLPALAAGDTVDLLETNSSGVSGQAILTSAGDQTSIVITLRRTGAAPSFPLVAHLHQGGTCASSQLQSAIARTDVFSEAGSEMTVPQRLADLKTGEFLINIHRPADMDHDLACGVIPPCDDANTGIVLLSVASRVGYRQSNGCEQSLSPDGTRGADVGDAVAIDETGTAELTFLDNLVVRIYRDTGIEIGGEVGPQATTVQRVTLQNGSVQVEAGRRVAIVTDGAVISSKGTKFFVYYGFGNITWVVVQVDEVLVEAQGRAVTVRAGDQTWVPLGSPPEPPVPATRAEVDRRFPTGTFPQVVDITDSRLQNGDVFIPTGPTPTVPPPADTTPPTKPTGLTASQVAGGILLTWTRSTDDVGVDAYDVYRGGTYLATVGGSETSYTDPVSGSGDAVYEYAVAARDAAGNRSALSEPVTVGYNPNNNPNYNPNNQCPTAVAVAAVRAMQEEPTETPKPGCP
jgi:FecR protein